MRLPTRVTNQAEIGKHDEGAERQPPVLVEHDGDEEDQGQPALECAGQAFSHRRAHDADIGGQAR